MTLFPETISALASVFSRLDKLLPDVRNLSATDEGVTFSYGRWPGYGHDGEMEWANVSFTWDEFLGEPGGDDIIALANLKHAEARLVEEAAEKVAKAALEKKEKANAARRRSAAKRSREDRERDELPTHPAVECHPRRPE